MKLTRHPQNPLLAPIPDHAWENRTVFNCAVTNWNNKIVLIYRAQGKGNNISRLGYAESSDGVNFDRLPEPIFVPETEDESNGVEDPRLTIIDGKLQMLYTAWSPEAIQVARASTTDFRNWERHGIAFPGPDNKDAAIFPEKVNGRYAAFHRLPPSMWIAYSDDMTHWDEYQEIMTPRPDAFDSLKLGAGGPPIETDEGWLVIYHGVDENLVYRLGVAMLDKDDPTRVIHRPTQPILEPEEDWELVGDVPNVVFTCGTAELGDDYLIYYGGADKVVALATVNKRDLIDFALTGE